MRVLHARLCDVRRRVLKTNPNPTREQLAHGVSGNLCRCQGLRQDPHRPDEGCRASAGSVTVAENTKKLIGQNYTTPDITAKVTGKAKMRGRLPRRRHAVDEADAESDAARAHHPPRSERGARDAWREGDSDGRRPAGSAGWRHARRRRAGQQPGREDSHKEPAYEGEPILAVAAVDELTAAEAIEKIVVEYEPLPFVVDPMVGLRPGSPNARTQGNTWFAKPAAPPAGAPAAGAAGAAAAGAAGAAAPAPGAAAAAAASPQAGAAAGASNAPQARTQGSGPAAGAPATGAPPAAGAAAGAAAGGEGRRAGGPGGAPGAGGRAGGPAGAPPPRPEIQEWKWTQADYDESAKSGHMPAGAPPPGNEWTWGNPEEGFKQADLVLEETFISQSTGHQPLETRSAMAYWQNGKLFLHGSTQSTVQTIGSVARWVGIKPSELVLISEHTGGGFGSKIPGAISMAIPALLAKKAQAPVMMRVSAARTSTILAAPGLVSTRV